MPIPDDEAIPEPGASRRDLQRFADAMRAKREREANERWIRSIVRDEIDARARGISTAPPPSSNK